MINNYILENTKLICFLLLGGGLLSCQKTEEQVVPLHTVAYNLEVLPLNKYQGIITYLNKEGKLDSATTSNIWRHEFKAKKGTILQASVISKPERATDRVIGAVILQIVIDGKTVYSGIGKCLTADYMVE